MRFTEADLFRLASAFGPLFAVLGLMELSGTVADGIMACVGAVAMSWVLTTTADTFSGLAMYVEFQKDDDDGQ